MSTEEIYQNIIEEAESLEQELIKLRREFHQYPEPGWMEMRTSARIAELLESYGCDQVLMGTEVCKADARMGVLEERLLEQHYKEVSALGQVSEEKLKKTCGGFTGVIGILHGKLSADRTASEEASERASENQVLAFRFDIDALPVTECENMDHFPEKQGFRSKCPGYMHACGHDGHITVGLGTAKILCGIKDQLRGTIKFIFQPAEEGVRGAKAIVEKGHLDDVDVVLGAHMSGKEDQKQCMIGIGDGHSLATTKMDVEFHGKAAHAAAAPEAGNNAMLAAATAILNLHAIPRYSHGDTRVNVGKLVAGSSRNVICESAHMEMEVRGMTAEANQYMYDYACRIIENAAQMHGCTSQIRLMGAATNSLNTPELMDRMKKLCEERLQLPVVYVPEGGVGGSEDYSCMSERVKEHGGQSCYFLNLSKCHATLHNDQFDFDEKALVNGVKVFACAAVELLMESALDPAFLERDRLRKSGIPVKIAKTERLLIRETISSDIPDLYEIWKQGGMVRGTVPVLNTLDEETEFMEAYIRHAYLFYDFGLWTVIEKQSGQIIGQAGLFVSELLDDAVELGYLIGQSYRGKGYAQECGRAILAYAEEVLDLEELHVLIERTNDTSLHVAQKLGFGPYGQDQIHGAETAEDTEASLVHWHKMLT